MGNNLKFTTMMSKTKCHFRFVIALLGISACILLCSTRYNLSIAIVSMVEDLSSVNNSLNDTHYSKHHYEVILFPENHKYSSSKSSENQIKWTEEQQGLSLGTYYYGFAVTHVFGGRIAERYGPKWVTATGLIGASIMNAILPIAAKIDFYLFISLRIIIGCFHGVVHPSLFFMFKNWFPRKEQTIALSMLLIGNALGLIINVPISAVIAKISPNSIPSWSLLFYGGSALHIIWLVLWRCLATDIPERHRMIKESEIFYIRQNSNNVLETNLRVVPWRKILKTKVLYASIMTKVCWSFNHAIIIDNGPSYLREIYSFTMLQASAHIASIYSTTVVVFLFSAPLFSILDKEVPRSHTRLRKIFQSIVFLGAATTMVALPKVGCNLRLLEILIIINMITQGFTSVGEYPMINEFAGYYSGTVYGIAITFDSIARALAPIIRGELVQNSNTRENWNIVFYITAILNLIGLVVFELCAATSLRDWALKKDLIKQISAGGHIEKPIKKELKLELQNPHYRQDINTETDDWKKFKTSTLVQ